MASASSDHAVVAAPKPRSPPSYPDFCGRRRLQLEVQMLHRELGFLEDEMQGLDGVQSVSRSCKEVNEFVGTKPDPLIPVNKKSRRSYRIWKWIRVQLCFDFSWTCCSCRCSLQLKRPSCTCLRPENCGCCPSCNCCNCGCPSCSCGDASCCCKPLCCTQSCCTPRCCCDASSCCKCQCPCPWPRSRCCSKLAQCWKLSCCSFRTCSCPEYSCGCVWSCPKCADVFPCKRCSSKTCCISGCLC